MTCTFAALGGLLSLPLSERRLGISFGRRSSGGELPMAATGKWPPLANLDH
jgi:hypothetical protein